MAQAGTIRTVATVRPWWVTAALMWCGVASAQPALPALPKLAPAEPPAAEYSETRTIGRHDIKLTVWRKDERLVRTALAAAMEEIARITRKLDASNRASEVSAINRIADTEEVLLSTETFQLVEQALKHCLSTERAFDPAVQSFDYLWQFQRRPAVRPLADELRKRAAFASCRNLALKPGRKVRLMERDMRISLDDLLIGHALERASALLRDAGVNSFRLRVGTHAYVFGRAGTRHWHLTVPHPLDSSRIVTQLYLGSHAAATRSQLDSAFTRDGVRYHDVLDPRTGQPARGVLQATVISADSVLADALSRAVMVMGVRKGLRHLNKLPNVEGFLVDEKGTVHASKGMASLARLPARITL